MSMTREDAYKMTREDVLRELELLPVWSLRAPMPAQAIVEQIAPVASILAEQTPNETPAVPTRPALLIVSDDKKWVFVLPAELTGQAADLFNNILRALHINKTQTSHTQQLKDMEALDAGVMIAMGESIAQQLLNSAEPIENLRGKQHMINGLQVIATYHPNDLLQHLPHKAKTWDDLCMALDVINA